MIDDLHHRVAEAAVVPILMAGDGDVPATVALADRLVEGGARMIEVLFRRPEAPEALAAIRARHRGLMLAAGTILDGEGATKAVAAGADVMVSPGFSPVLHAAAQAAGVPLIPGVNTASEVQVAREMGYLVQKFYPAWDHGHRRLPEFDAIYGGVSFLVTGHLGAGDVADYARHRNVAALGGTWMLDDPASVAAAIAQVRAVRG